MAETVYKPPFEAQEKQFSIIVNRETYEKICLLYGKRIIVSGNAVDNDETTILYTVPDQTVFLCLSVSLSICSGDTVRRTSYAFTKPPGGTGSGGVTRSFLFCGAAIGGQSTASISPCIPLIFQAGEQIAIFNEDTDTTTLGSVVGYEIPVNYFII